MPVSKDDSARDPVVHSDHRQNRVELDEHLRLQTDEVPIYSKHQVAQPDN